MHVLLLAPLYFPYVGGAETHTRALAEALVTLGQQVTVCTDTGYRPVPEQEIVGGVRVLRTRLPVPEPGADQRDVVRWEAGPFGLLAELERLLRLGDLGRPDVIHAQCQISFLLGAVLKEHLGSPLAVTPHETTPEHDGLGRARSRFLYTLPQIDLFVASSRTFAEQAIMCGRPAADIVVVPSAALPAAGVAAGQARSPRVGGPRTGATVLNVGRFKPRKNQLALLRAVSQLRDGGLDVRCVLAGSCDAGSLPYLAEVRRLASRMGDAAVLVVDADNEGIAKLMTEADLVVQCATAEGLGIVAIEALNAGTPVIATPTLGAMEVLGDFPCLLTRGFAAGQIASAIQGALARPAEFAAAADAASASARRRFDAVTNAAGVLDLYRRVTGHTP